MNGRVPSDGVNVMLRRVPEYRVDSSYADETGIAVRAGEHVVLSHSDAQVGVKKGYLRPVGETPSPPREESDG